MKRFFSLMLVALVMLGVTACEQDITIDSAKSEGLSFYADLAMTRAQLEYDDAAKVWKTTWEAGDVIVVGGYEFTNTVEEPNKFSCDAEGVDALVGTKVEVSYGVDEFSTAGTKGVQAGATIEDFQAGDTIALEATNSFLRYNYAGEGVVTFSLTFDGAEAPNFSYAGLLNASNVTFVGATEDRFVAFDAPESGVATLSYSINGVKCKETTIDVVAGKIYNLGTLTDPEPMQYAVYVTPQPKSYFNTFSNVNLYSWKSEEIKNDEWPGVDVTEQYVVIDGRKYYYYTYPSTWNDDTEVLAIVNNGSAQTADITLGKLENNYFIVYTHTSEVATAPFATVDDFAGLYLKPNSNWTQASARFAAYFFDNGTNTNTWVGMTQLKNIDYYYLEAYDSKYPSVIFCRMNPSTTANNWDNKWNQTSDLTIPTDGKSIYTVKVGTWDNGGGTWSAI